jgi:hypothetical protein
MSHYSWQDSLYHNDHLHSRICEVERAELVMGSDMSNSTCRNHNIVVACLWGRVTHDPKELQHPSSHGFNAEHAAFCCRGLNLE